MKRFAWVAVTALGLSAWAHADTLTFNTSDSQFLPGSDNQGWWSGTRSNSNSNDNYFTGSEFGDLLRSFFTFDLSALTGNVVSAKLELVRYTYISSDNSETLGLYDVTTDARTLNANIGTSTAIFDDLGSGTSYGTFVVSQYDYSSSIVLSFQLNDAALADINAAKGKFFSIGASLESLNHPESAEEAIMGGSSGYGTQRLVLETGLSAQAVPLPAAAWMGLTLLTGMGGTSIIRRRLRKN